MRECKKCRVNILDDTAVCPLCSSVLEISGEEEQITGYPDVTSVSRKLSFIVRLYSFLAIVSEAALIVINLVVCGYGNLYFVFLHYAEILTAEEPGLSDGDTDSGHRRSASGYCGGSYCGIPGLVCELCAARGDFTAERNHCYFDDYQCLQLAELYSDADFNGGGFCGVYDSVEVRGDYQTRLCPYGSGCVFVPASGYADFR